MSSILSDTPFGASQDLPVRMVRPHLDNIPAHPLPEPFSIRWFRKGDQETWTRLQRAAEKTIPIGDALFDEQFGGDLEGLQERMCFLLDRERKEIATAVAWYDKKFGDGAYGRVHWVAVVPEYQGRGLSRPLLRVVCQRLKILGHSKAFLSTSASRLPAIKLYLGFGFLPLRGDPGESEAWSVFARQSGISIP